MNRCLWISWTIARRSRELAPEFGARLYEFSWHKIPGIRYLIAFPATIAVILLHRPKIVFVQNPSIFCAALVVLLKKIIPMRVAVDAHTMVIPLSGWKQWAFDRLSRFIEKDADLVIVTNRYLADGLEARGARAAILPDKIPSIRKTRPLHLPGRQNIVYICSFAEDEPYLEVFAASALLDPGVHITVTGNYRRVKNLDPCALPTNVHLTGFVSDEEYGNVLHSADAILVLTHTPSCMLCGAYEAVAVEKPLILSNQIVLREYFREGTHFVENESKSIAKGIANTFGSLGCLKDEMTRYKVRLQSEWKKAHSKALAAALSAPGKSN